jgi:hypothetical protein
MLCLDRHGSVCLGSSLTHSASGSAGHPSDHVIGYQLVQAAAGRANPRL